ncbi:MAG: Hint domain-containing protein [Pseudomonadota bacterium]
MVQATELDYTTNASDLLMAQTIFGAGATVVGASYTGWSQSSAIYDDPTGSGDNFLPNSSGVILSTGRASDFTNSTGDANQSNFTGTDSPGTGTVQDFNDVAGQTTFDAAYLDVDFTTENDLMTMQFIFASDEFPEFTSSIYNDVLAVWVNGVFVPLSIGNGDTSINQINEDTTQNLYTDNADSAFNTEMDGFTVTMSLTFPVTPTTDPSDPQVNTVRIGVADASDSVYDTNVIIGANAIQTELIAIDDDLTMGTEFTKTFNLLGNDEVVNFGVQVTHINGVELIPGQSVILNSGQAVLLNSDWTITVTSTAQPAEDVFTYDIIDNVGNTSTGFVTLETVPCFVAGTMILTPDGERRIEDLVPGDLVVTHDNGAQPIRWAGQRTMSASGKMAPIRIREGALGDHRQLLVSPQHRILVRDTLSELLFGEPEVLVSAKHLVDDHSIRVEEGGFVTYVHLLFDRHEVVFSEGLATESFLPGPQTTDCFEEEVLDEICEIFPELDPQTGSGYSPSVRRTLKSHEAKVFMKGVA